MDRRQFLQTAGGAALTGAPCTRAPRQPNIVLIMADDLGYSDIGCYGGEIETPNLDRLAGQGVRFTRFYNAARCCPTRASLMTGLYQHQAGMGHMWREPNQPVPSYQGFLNNRCRTIAEVLREAGYQTFLSGKWHLTYNKNCLGNDTCSGNPTWSEVDSEGSITVNSSGVLESTGPSADCGEYSASVEATLSGCGQSTRSSGSTLR